ncbi:MAG TPA: VWA domain-containing protein [Candidatus Faecousia gallistercoris]|nr:VWA domain-containing protein [Candidatus Faecousia gallistercoris]
MLKRNKKLASRLLAALMALACVLTLLPGAAMAAGEDDGGKMVVDKTATLEDDGTYTIELSAYATGQTTTEIIKTGKPLDIVLVLDQSGSMADSIKSYRYTARPTDSYSYQDCKGNEYYYLDTDGNYYRVQGGGGGIGFGYYYLYYVKNGEQHRLGGGWATVNTTLWSGVLYTRQEISSMSKLDALKAAVTNFVNSVSANAKEFNVDHQIALVGFASNQSDGKSNQGSVSYGSSDKYWVNTGLFVNGQLKNYKTYQNRQWNSLTAQDYRNALVSVNTNGSITQSITTAISCIADSGGTRTSYGLEMAQNVFANNPIPAGSDRQRVVVLFTDGEPGQSGYDSSEANSAISEAYTLKNTHNAKVYTVGLYDDDPSSYVTNFMNYTSSNYPSAQSTYNHGNQVDDKYYMTASDADELNKIFTNIVNDSTESSTTVTLDAESVLRDILNNGFVLPAGYNVRDNITVATKPGQMDEAGEISWDEDNIQENPSGITATADEETGTIEVTGFDYSERYIAEEHPGDVLLVTIRGVEATDAAITNAEISTNDAASGIYENTGDEEPFVRFPEPKTILKSKTYVLDYGKPVNLNAQDWGIGSISTLNGDGMHRFYSPVWNLTEDYGKVSATQSGLTYTPTTMNWDGYDNLYVFGKQIAEDGAENQWSRVTVMPANSVYYEDTFVTDSNTGKVGIEYTGNWAQMVEGTSGGNTQTVDDGHPYGWEESYDDITFSDGCAHCVTASDGEVAQASFTFTGTGVDVYSKTDMTTGTVYAVLEPQFESENAKVQRLIVDNLAESNGETGYYQIPTVSFQDLTYGEYKVTIMVTTAAEGRSTYYLDGVRVYNPIQGLEEDQLVQDAYGADHELNAVFQEVRDILVTQANLPEGDELPNNSVVFIDQVDGQTGVTTSEVGTYVEYGPKNEVYLAPGQSIAFQVATGSNSHYYLGLKGPAGATQAEATNGTGKMQIKICGSCDMYYEVTPSADGIVMVRNTGENLLSITKLRTTSDSEDENAGIVGASVSELLAYADTFDSLEVVEYPTDLGDVEIENPDVQELGDGSVAWEWLQKIFRGIWDLLRP